MILVCGEALIDLLPTAEGGGTRNLLEAAPGGSPFNVAIGMSRLGAASAFLGGLSSDGFGRMLREMLTAEGVDLSYAVATDRLTTLSVVHRGPDGSASYAFHGEGKADRAPRPADMPDSLPDDCRALTFGSYTIAVDPVGGALLSLARREAGRRVISLDPNVRPSVTPDMAAWRARFGEFLATADIVKASEEDLGFAYGQKADLRDIARDWLTKGPEIVFVTLGPAGAIAFTRDGREIAAPGRRIEVADTVGAGDTFHAATLTELDRRGLLSRSALAALGDRELREVLDHAITAASITCSRRGADLPRRDEVLAACATRDAR